FSGCDLTSVDFTRANLVECAFTESVLNGTDYSYSTVDYGNFSDSDLAGAIFQGANLSNSDFSMAENLGACRFDEETVWPDNEYLPEDFDSTYMADLSSLKDEDDYAQSDY
ncbi:pentapeptide repeat-containing protein, partial [bacterium]|nr:pentapeptide repeat-containing protein [bacterium]